MKKIKYYASYIFDKTIPYLVSFLFIIIFGQLFGSENMLVSVALAVALTMFPLCDLKWKPLTLVSIILGLNIGSILVAQLALTSPLIALPINFLFVIAIILLSNEPVIMKPSISFLLCFVFAQSTPVAWNLFPNRLWCTLLGSIIVILVTLVFWHHLGYDKGGRTIKQQINCCNQNHRYLFRMAFGIAIAMLIGMSFHIKKPLWISIVVMSLTQIDFQETVMRIKHRLIGNVLGIVVFILFLQLLIPKQYAMYFILLIGYIGVFTTEYKYKQVINAVSALNASLVLLDTKAAIFDRLGLFLIGTVIVFVLYECGEWLKYLKEHYTHYKVVQYVDQILHHDVILHGNN